MRKLRQILFWLHLTCGVTAGLVIAGMCFTGALLAFEKQITAWSERTERHVAPPNPESPKLSVREMIQRVRDIRPEARPGSIVISSDPSMAVAFGFGRDGTLYIDPYSGEVREPKSAGLRAFFQAVENWHRSLAFAGDHRGLGRAISGVANCAFLILATTGLYLWIPRTWSWSGMRAVAVFNFKLTGKARDFNWHNTIGVWCAPVLVVLTLTAVPMSYRRANDLIYRLTGSEPPAQAGPGDAGPSAVGIVRAPGGRPLGYDALLAIAQKEYPQWETISIRLGGDRRRSAAPGDSREPKSPGAEHAGPQAATLTVRSADQWPLFSNSTLTLDPFRGAVLQRDDFAGQSAGRKIRSWARFLHTGEALGFAGQLAAALASLGACFLAYTGLALAWRRFFPRKTGGA
jgi:uncharacterized iron-regulated membrane protein